jgi:hypothetical protein
VRWIGVAALCVTTAFALFPAMSADAAPPRRAKPPIWTPDVLDAFFEDAREHLVGERPAPGSDNVPKVESVPGNNASNGVSSPQPFAWSRLASGEALEAEVKHLVGGLREPLANATRFKAGGYKQCRATFSVLAVLFGVIAEHNGDVRWKEEAGALRDSMARAARNCKTATEQTFAEASQRRAELEDLVRGERIDSGKAKPLEMWSDLAERPVLMQRMERLVQEEITPALGNAKEFTKRAVEVRQKAELLAVLANVTQREEYEYWDDVGFQELSGELRSAVSELTRAAADVNYEAARAAAGRTGQACSQCHEGYRG